MSTQKGEVENYDGFFKKLKVCDFSEYAFNELQSIVLSAPTHDLPLTLAQAPNLNLFLPPSWLASH